MEQVSIIYLRGDFDESMVRSFKHRLRNSNTKTIIIRLHSYGGNLHAMNIMSAFLYFLIKYKKRTIIFEIEHAESAALMLAVNFPHRRVVKKSTCSIHLPVLIKNKNASQEVINDKKKKAITFFTQHTKLKDEDVVMLENTIITANQMIEKGIATELVDSFSPIAA